MRSILIPCPTLALAGILGGLGLPGSTDARAGCPSIQEIRLLDPLGDQFGRFVHLEEDVLVAIDGDRSPLAAVYLDDGSNFQPYLTALSCFGFYEQRPSASAITAPARCGSDVSLTVLLGFPLADVTGTDSGGVDVLMLADGACGVSQCGFLDHTPAPGDRFGAAVATSDLGQLVVGASGDDLRGPDAGAAYVFAGSGQTPSQILPLPGDGLLDGDEFGAAIDCDGDWMLIGVPGASPGEVWAYERSGTAWVLTQKILAPAGSSRFGRFVDLDADSTPPRAVVGGSPAPAGDGVATVVVFDGSSWVIEDETIDGNARYGAIGGGFAIVTGSFIDPLCSNPLTGPPRLYVRTDDDWHRATCAEFEPLHELGGKGFAIRDDGLLASGDPFETLTFTFDCEASVSNGVVYVYDLGCFEDCDGSDEPDCIEVVIDPGLDCDEDGLLDACEPAGCAVDCTIDWLPASAVESLLDPANWSTLTPPKGRLSIVNDSAAPSIGSLAAGEQLDVCAATIAGPSASQVVEIAGELSLEERLTIDGGGRLELQSATATTTTPIIELVGPFAVIDGAGDLVADEIQNAGRIESGAAPGIRVIAATVINGGGGILRASSGELEIAATSFVQAGDVIADAGATVSVVTDVENDGTITVGGVVEVPSLVNRFGAYADLTFGVVLDGGDLDLPAGGLVHNRGGRTMRGFGRINRPGGTICGSDALLNDVDPDDGLSLLLVQDPDELGRDLRIDGGVLNRGVIWIEPGPDPDAPTKLIVCDYVSEGGAVIPPEFIECLEDPPCLGPAGPPEFPGDGGVLEVAGAFLADAASWLALGNGRIEVEGDFTYAIDDPQRFVMERATVELNGFGFFVTQQVEIASPDVGSNTDPTAPPPFTIGELSLGPAAKARLVDQVDNGSGGPEVLYTGRLVLEPLAELNLGGMTVYVEEIVADDRDAQIVLEGGQLIEAPLINRADIDRDGDVDVEDLIALLSGWGPCPADPAPCSADVVVDGVVDALDLLIVLARWTA